MATHRRSVLAGSLASFLLSLVPARARTIAGKLPWHPSAGIPPAQTRPGGWEFFTAEEGATVEALVDRLIPPDPKFAGGKAVPYSSTGSLPALMAAHSASTCEGRSKTERRSKECNPRKHPPSSTDRKSV